MPSKKEKSKGKIVYTCMTADGFHIGHQKIIDKCWELAGENGEVILGLMTDESVASYKRVPRQSYEQRKHVLEGKVTRVIPQRQLDYRPNLELVKPDIVVNGDDWKHGVQRETRQQVIEWLKRHGGKLVEPPYTEGISSTLILDDLKKEGVTPEYRRGTLRVLLKYRPIVRVLEAHNGLSALMVERTRWGDKEFDAIWVSSLTDSTAKGKPDIELVDFTSRVQTIDQILDVTTKPLIVDGDTGGMVEHFEFIVKTLERLGVSAIIIEDKVFPKNNSLADANQNQETIQNFSLKIKKGKMAQVTDNFMIIARIESLIAGKSVDDAIERAKAYIRAGADAIMIHSKERKADKIFEFCSRYNKLKVRVPLVAVPTTYCSVTEKELIEHGVNIVIYANHLLRSSLKAMKKTAETILKYERALEAEEGCCSVKEILNFHV